MKKFLPQFAVFFALFVANSYGAGQYPNVSGSALFQFNADRVMSTQKTQVPGNNAFVYVESDFALHIDRNWAVKTQWRLQPNDVLTTRNEVNPERYRTFLDPDRGIKSSGYGLLVEELKLQFGNEDMQFSAGKFDPKFGTAHDKRKRMGIFTSQFAEDYNLREKIGLSISALLEKSKITVNSFFNDTTGLSGSALDDRGNANSKDGSAGSTKALNSYSVSIEGKDFFEIEDWSYNLGFKSLSVDRLLGRQREKGYVLGSEYLYKIGETSIIPFVELVKVTSIAGEQGRRATYKTAAIIAKYSSWTGSFSLLSRSPNSHRLKREGKASHAQLSVGYKFTENITLDVTRSNMREDGYSGSVVGILLNYFYRF
jgi:hypothetical protein